MVECNYCDEAFPESDQEDEPFVTHLAEEHHDELSRIDRHIVEDNWDGDFDDPTLGEDYLLSPIQIGAVGAVCAFFVGIIAVGLI